MSKLKISHEMMNINYHSCFIKGYILGAIFFLLSVDSFCDTTFLVLLE